jgi:hypothetical protein
MKSLIVPICLGLAGCQTAAPVPLSPPRQPEIRTAPVTPVVQSSTPALERKVRQQAQYIEALLSQNEALTAKLAAAPSLPAAAAAAPLASAKPSAVLSTPATDSGEAMLSPNSEGVIDLTAAESETHPGELANPFAVRAPTAGNLREVSLRVSGILSGPIACAVINDRLFQANESVDALTVDRIEAEAVCLKFRGQRLRVPVSDQAVKVKIPL